MDLIAEILFERYQIQVDGFVYFTSDRKLNIPSTNGDGNIWIKNESVQTELPDFLWKIGESFQNFIGDRTGRKAILTHDWDKDSLNNIMPLINFIK
jgi:hypothetical protein